jgi:sulfite reductase (ferredoxin)
MTEPPSPTPKRSIVEVHKEESRQLRGTIADELANSSLDHFSDANKSLIKFHGTYQQEDRDARKTRRKEGLGKFYIFMVRCKIPGGYLTPEQYLAVDDLAERYANKSLRLTSRQGIQLHGVLKKDLHATIRGINDCLLTTLGACGDVTRNVMSCPAAFDPVRRELRRQALAVASHFAPRTGAYHEIWLNGKPQTDLVATLNRPAPADHDQEPIYGKVYLPRKFKIGFGLPDDNCVDIFAQDLGFLAIHERQRILGYNVLIGGGMGMTHGNANTFPFLGREIAWIEPDQVLAAAEAAVKLFRDHGNRADRKRARIKYLVHDWGVDRFREIYAGYLPFPLVLPKDVSISGVDLHHGWHDQGDGKWCLGISIENGRIQDTADHRLRSGLRDVIASFRPNLCITPQQDLLLTDIAPESKLAIDRRLSEYGIRSPERISLLERYGMACPAIPTCGLAISESERALPQLIDQLESVLAELGLEALPISIRMTGCPNGCVRPYQSDIGIVGRSGDKYTVFVGGNRLGNRLNFMLCDLVPFHEITPLLASLFRVYRDERVGAEGFGDYCHRLGPAAIRQRAGVSVDATSH